MMETAVMTNKDIAQAVYTYFGKGKVPAILDLVTYDIKWTSPGPTDILPSAQAYHGKEGVSEFFRLTYANLMQTRIFQISKSKNILLKEIR